MEERKMNLALALAEYGTSTATTYDLSFVNAKGEKVSKNLTKPENVKLMIALDESQRLGKRLDLARCLLFATIERTLNQDKALGISTRDLIMQKWHYSKATTNQYLAIGLKFFTNTGNEKVEGISQFTVGQIIPFLALVNDFPTIGGMDTDYKFLEWFIVNEYIKPTMTTTEIEGIAKLLKDGHLPKEWVKDSTDARFPYFVQCADKEGQSDLQFTLCPYLEEVEHGAEQGTEEQGTEEQGTEEQGTEEQKPEENKLSVSVRKFLADLQDYPMSLEPRDELSTISEAVIKWAVKAEKAKEEQKPEEQGTEEQGTEEQKPEEQKPEEQKPEAKKSKK